MELLAQARKTSRDADRLIQEKNGTLPKRWAGFAPSRES